MSLPFLYVRFLAFSHIDRVVCLISNINARNSKVKRDFMRFFCALGHISVTICALIHSNIHRDFLTSPPL
ncbi:hypothetical protein EKN77_03710 [Enterobacter hormaechei]|nr:hypothetical protein EKN77_03710 [Enterobacter hormaechei]